MRPLLLLFPLLFAVSYGKPGGSYSYPAPTPSAPPALLSNLGIASPSIAPSLLTPTASVAPELYNLPSASLAPSILAPNPSIAPSLLINDVVGAGQYGAPVVNIGGSHSLGVQPLGFQSLGFQSLGDQSLGLGLSQFGYPLSDQGYNFDQSGFNLGNSLVAIGSPQLSVGPTELPQVTPTPDFSVTGAHFGSIGPTIATLGPSVQSHGGVVVQKHVYVHVAPEEPEEIVPHKPIVLPPPRRNYKIIFIKAPTPPTPTAPVIPPPVQDEERTLIYVLVKRPEEQPEIKIQTPPPTTPAKPEVYFIKYNTRKESTASGAVPSGPVLIDNGGIETGPIVEDIIKGSVATAPTVSIGSVTPTNVALDLNKATLSGGSALSLAVSGSPLEGGSLQVSSTPAPVYGPPQHK